MSKWIVTAVVATAALLWMADIGQGQEIDRWQVMLRLDKDGDGKISAAEYGGGEERFARYDKDKDGFITEDELKAVGAGKRGDGAAGAPGRRGPRRGRRPNPTVDLVRAADADANKETTRGEWTTLVASLKGDDGAVDNAKLMAKLAPKGAPKGPPKDGPTGEGDAPKDAPKPPEGGRGGRGGGPGAARGGRRGPSPEMMTRAFDRNRDGTLDDSDFAAIFTEFDKDEDGKIVEAELTAAQTAQRLARSAGVLARIADADKSGDVTKDEWDTFMLAVGTESGEVDIDAVLGMMQQMRGGRGGGDRMKPMLTRMFDADGDEKVTTKEFDAAYETLDKNGDGAIDAEEMPQRRGGMGGRGGRGR